MKKAQLQIPGTMVDFYAYIAFILVAFTFMVIFLLAKGQIVANIQSDVEDINAQTTLRNVLRTPITYEETQMTIGDLIIFYCSQKNPNELDKIRIYSNIEEILSKTTITAKLICSENKEILFRKPLCNSPSTIKIPSLSNQNEIKFCSSIESAEEARHVLLIQTITTPDGKKWAKRQLGDVIYYQEHDLGVTTENLITTEEFNKRYAFYEESEEYKLKVEKFQEDIKTKSRLVAPDGSVWNKIGNNWCMVITKEGILVDCEVTILTTEKLIETKGEVPVGTRIVAK